jgi:WD40 repeat protein
LERSSYRLHGGVQPGRQDAGFWNERRDHQVVGRGRGSTAGNEKGVWLWDLPPGTKSQALSGLDQPAARLAFSANGNALAALSADGKSVLAWDLSGNVAPCRVNHERGAVGALALSPDGRMLVTTVKDGKTVFTWKLDP